MVNFNYYGENMMNFGGGNIMGFGGSWMWPVYNGMLGFGLVGIILVLLFAIFWVWMLVDAVTRDFKNDTEKVVWVLVIIFTHILGALIYYLVVNLREKSSRKRRR